MKRAWIRIRGIVQGVGFRPFIHKYVEETGLYGFIKNTSSGVELELEGTEKALSFFLEHLEERAPRLAVIEKIETEYYEELKHYTEFQILASKTEEKRNTLISPDIAICEDCKKELFDPKDRRYRYPFINCTNCGPRFTIIEDVPYDRKNTSMKDFPMCPACEKEYHEIRDRRYHAQPDCCPDCGPELLFFDGEGKTIDGDAVHLAKTWLKQKKILAVKGLGGIHLACLSREADIVQRLRQRKQRDEKPFAVMCRDMETVRKICEVSEAEEKILTGFRKPIVLLRKKAAGPECVSENGYLGVMLPYTPVHCLLMEDPELDMLIMTSANLSDRPILYKNEEAIRELKGIADGFLLNNREIQTRCDDSLCWVLDGSEYFARRSRGYIPFPIKIPQSRGIVLACGAEQKASFCLSKNEYIFQSQHIGDLKNLETYENYTQQIRHYEHMFDLQPEMICCDLHPDYMSTSYAERRAEEERIPVVHVQHHHAHMVSCMADNGLDNPVIGLIWDGTGYGEDHTIWGSECLIGNAKGYRRFGSIRPIPLPGGDKAAKEICRSAYALLRESGCKTGQIPEHAGYGMMMERNLNCPKSSGMGRLFDGAAAIIGIKELCSYEGQGAVLLEAAAIPSEESYPWTWETDTCLRFDWRPMIREMVREKENHVSAGIMAAKFMNTLVQMGTEMCVRASRQYGITDVVLSGGSFQNMYLMQRLPAALRAAGLTPYYHHRVSTNDEGLSVGQILIAQNRGKEHVSGNTIEAN